jgi:hypothetical protein
MGQAVFSNNSTIKVAGTIGAGSAPSTGQFAIANYVVNANISTNGGVPGFQIYYGPGQTISATVNIGTTTPQGNFFSAVLFSNSP